MKELSRRIRLSKQSPPMTPPLLKYVEYDGMTEFGNQLLLGIEPEWGIGNFHTKKPLRHVKSSMGEIP